MGILNITPDSFFGPSRTTADDVLRRVGREGWNELHTRPGAAAFASAFFKDSGCFELGEGALFILVVIIGNAIGGLLIPLCQKYMYENPPAWFKKE